MELAISLTPNTLAALGLFDIYARMVLVLDLALEHFGTVEHCGNPAVDPLRTGFAVSILHRPTGRYIVVPHGTFAHPKYIFDRVGQYMVNAAEKVTRTHRRRDETSYPSRDPDRNMYAGAVRVGDYIIAISGLSSGWKDQAAVLVAGRSITMPETDRLSAADALRIAFETQDPEYASFVGFAGKHLQLTE